MEMSESSEHTYRLLLRLSYRSEAVNCRKECFFSPLIKTVFYDPRGALMNNTVRILELFFNILASHTYNGFYPSLDLCKAI